MAVALLVLMSLGALAALSGGLRHPNARAVAWTPAGYFLLVLAWLGSSGSVIGAFFAPRRGSDYIAAYSGPEVGIAQIFVYGTGLIAATFSLLALRLWAKRDALISAPGFLAVLLVCLGIYSNEFNSVSTSIRQYADMFATLIILLAATLIRPGKDAVLGPAVYGLSLAIFSGLLPLADSQAAFVACRADKCGPLGVIFVGVMGNENALGLALTLSLPFILLAFRGYTRWALGIYVFVIIYLTGSRSALAAAFVVLVLAIVCNPRIDGEQIRGRLPVVAAATGFAAVIAGWAIPLFNVDRSAFTYRGWIWEIAKQNISESPFLGSGSEGWRELVRLGIVPAFGNYSAHNLWIHAIFSTGLLGILLLVFLVGSLLATSSRWLLALPLIASFVVGILENPWVFAATNWLVWVLPALILLRNDPSQDANEFGLPSRNPLYRAHNSSAG